MCKLMAGNVILSSTGCCFSRSFLHTDPGSGGGMNEPK
jgi:hypothetical protein